MNRWFFFIYIIWCCVGVVWVNKYFRKIILSTFMLKTNTIYQFGSSNYTSVAYVGQFSMPKINVFVLTHEVYWSTLPSYGYCLGSSDNSHHFGLYSHYHGSCGIYKYKCKEVLGLFYISNNFFLSHQGQYCRVVIVSNPGFLELTKWD